MRKNSRGFDHILQFGPKLIHFNFENFLYWNNRQFHHGHFKEHHISRSRRTGQEVWSWKLEGMCCYDLLTFYNIEKKESFELTRFKNKVIKFKENGQNNWWDLIRGQSCNSLLRSVWKFQLNRQPVFWQLKEFLKRHQSKKRSRVRIRKKINFNLQLFDCWNSTQQEFP